MVLIIILLATLPQIILENLSSSVEFKVDFILKSNKVLIGVVFTYSVTLALVGLILHLNFPTAEKK